MRDAVESGQGLMAFWSSIAPEHQLAYQRWHNAEHIPERVSTPGFLKGRRYRSIAEPDRFLMFYETLDPGVLSSPAYLAKLNAPTRWTQEALTWFQRSTRAVFSLAQDVGAPGGWPAPVLVSVRFDVPEPEPAGAFAAGLEALRASGLFHRIRRYRLNGDNRSGSTHESAIHGARTGTLGGLLMGCSTELDLLDVAEAQGQLREALAHAIGRSTLTTAEVEIYSLDFALDSLTPLARGHG